jgi:hypothetical protein
MQEIDEEIKEGSHNPPHKVMKGMTHITHSQDRDHDPLKAVL